MSRQELADLVNAYLAGIDDREATLDANYVGKLERGDHRWPNGLRRDAIRHVLNAATDTDLGFHIIRGLRPTPADTVQEWPLDLPPITAAAESLTAAGGSVDRRALLKKTLNRAALGAGIGLTSKALLWQAAHASAALSAALEAKELGPRTLQEACDDLRRLTTDYVITSDLPRIFGEALLLRDRLGTLIEWRTARPRDAQELYVMMGATCLLLASISHDSGEPDAGMMQARAAERCAELAQHPELFGWVLCTKAMIDLWRQRPSDVLVHAERARAFAVCGTTALRLKGLQVRALAELNRTTEASELMRQIEQAPAAMRSPGSMADYGSMFSFPESRQLYYAVVSHAQLGDHGAVERYVAALGHPDQPPIGDTWPVSWALSRSYLALARLSHQGTDGGPDGAAHALAPVLTLPKVQRINQLGQVVSDLGRRVNAREFRDSTSARALGETIHEFLRPSALTNTAS